MINLARRKAVMERSIKLGHCVCNPKKPCPCDTFKDYNVCTCAGEKLPIKKDRIALTQYVRNAGCTSKVGQADLKRILGKLPPITDPNVLVGTAAGDDAGVYRIDDKYNLVQTVDVFTPCVDDPYLFGQITAANSLSDIYAMGGKPLTALSIIGFPIDELDSQIMEAILLGGMEKLQEANCSLIGGHSIDNEEIMCGYAITGLIDTKNVVKRNNAQVGDALVLTKPLGTGMIAFAIQINKIDDNSLEEVGQSMATLNKDAGELMIKYNANACTDVTGFGLIGHLVEMVNGSGVSAEIDMSLLPVFSAVKNCLENDILPGAIERNQEYSMAWVKVVDSKYKKNLPILYDPQTSGGLLISLPEKKAKSFVKEMHNLGHISTSIIGKIIKKDIKKLESEVIIINSELKNFTNEPEKGKKSKKEDISCCSQSSSTSESGQESCCASSSNQKANTEKLNNQSKDLFVDFLKEVNKEGLIDKRNKKLMAVALSISRNCKQCLTLHLKNAIAMGIPKEEIDEAAYLAIAFTGAPAMMLYNDVCKELGI